MTDTAIDITPVQPIAARAGRYYRNARYVMTALVLAMAGYFAYDGWSGYPAHNLKVDEVTQKLNTTTDDAEKARLGKELKALGEKHQDKDIQLQKQLAIGLPFPAIAYLIFVVRRSRGVIRLENDTLTAPGHPPMTLAEITQVDKSQWKKKGIAKFHYTAAGRAGVVTLDDFVYQQKPIDDIYEVIARHHGVWEAPTPKPVAA